MSNDLDAKRIKILEERVSVLEHKLNHVSAPILDAIESFRRDTLTLFEGFAQRLEKHVEAEAARAANRVEGMLEEAEARNAKRFSEVLQAIRRTG
jgi:hypothetical protein